MKIKLPKDISGYNIATLHAVMGLQEQLKPDKDGNVIDVDVELQAAYLAAFTGEDIDDILETDIFDIKRAFNYGLTTFANYKKKMPPETITINGQEYYRLHAEKQKGGWYVDVKVMAEDFNDKPELVAALNYVEKGMKYSQRDKEKNTLNPTKKRAEIFKEYFPADVFLDMSAFFLAQFEALTKISLELKLRQVEKNLKQLQKEIV